MQGVLAVFSSLLLWSMVAAQLIASSVHHLRAVAIHRD